MNRTSSPATLTRVCTNCYFAHNTCDSYFLSANLECSRIRLLKETKKIQENCWSKCRSVCPKSPPWITMGYHGIMSAYSKGLPIPCLLWTPWDGLRWSRHLTESNRTNSNGWAAFGAFLLFFFIWDLFVFQFCLFSFWFAAFWSWKLPFQPYLQHWVTSFWGSPKKTWVQRKRLPWCDGRKTKNPISKSLGTGRCISRSGDFDWPWLHILLQSD